MIVLFVSILDLTYSKNNDNANRRGGLNQMPHASTGTQTWPYRALQVDLLGGRAYMYMCIYIYTSILYSLSLSLSRSLWENKELQALAVRLQSLQLNNYRGC